MEKKRNTYHDFSSPFMWAENKNEYIYLLLANNKYIKYIVQYCVRNKYIVRTSILFLRFLDCRLYIVNSFTKLAEIVCPHEPVTKSEYLKTVGREEKLN